MQSIDWSGFELDVETSVVAENWVDVSVRVPVVASFGVVVADDDDDKDEKVVFVNDIKFSMLTISKQI